MYSVIQPAGELATLTIGVTRGVAGRRRSAVARGCRGYTHRSATHGGQRRRSVAGEMKPYTDVITRHATSSSRWCRSPAASS